MDSVVTYEELKDYLRALVLSQPRILAMFIALPLFNAQLVPGMLRYGMAGAFGIFAVPLIQSQLVGVSLDTPAMWAMVMLKEAFIGFVLGLLVAIPFWIFEGIGFLVDNQRGASISATLNPLTGNDSSPMGILTNQAFIVFFLISGGFTLMLGMLYDSFALWSVPSWSPHLNEASIPFFLSQLDRLVRMTMLLAAPAVVAMFLAELGLALVSRFVPQLQVFFIAMPVKSALAVLILILYASTIFDYGFELVEGVGEIARSLDSQWGAP